MEKILEFPLYFSFYDYRKMFEISTVVNLMKNKFYAELFSLFWIIVFLKKNKKLFVKCSENTRV